MATSTVVGFGLSGSSVAASSTRPSGDVVVVQAVPQDKLTVAIDGKTVHSQAAVGSVLGPYRLPVGTHQLTFTAADGGVRLASTVHVGSGSSSDVVVHCPAAVHGKPVVNLYRTPTGPIAPGKARVLIAHTATVAPADVRVDGHVVFRDIANGEYATADVAAGPHRVALLPTGVTGHPILGPISLDLQPGTVTMVYAVGDPSHGSMHVILHRTALASNGVVAPTTIDTGSAGLAARFRVVPFGAAR